MTRLATLLKRSLIFVHRWIGVTLSALAMLWFASGIVMMYWSFPSVSTQDRLARLPILDPSRVVLSADEAFSRLGLGYLPGDVLLTSFDGRPAYLGAGMMVYADDGREQIAVEDDMIDRAAAAWSGRPLSEATKTAVEEIDQWTVGGDLRGLRPMFKYAWPDGQQVYVDGRTADVVQYTTTASRFWAYLGAIPHWLYFTPLRTQQREWFSLVVWSSLIGTVTALIGLVIAAWMYSPRRRYRHAGVPTGIPYRGWKRWHTIAGLLFGLITVTWTFSGLLSMGPFPIVERIGRLIGPSDTRSRVVSPVNLNLSRTLRGRRLDFSLYADRRPSEAIAAVAGFDVRELEYTSFDGEPMYLVSNGLGDSRIVPVHGAPRATFDADDLMRRVRAAAGEHLADLRLMDTYDAYYVDRRGVRPLPVIALRLNDAIGSRYYIDPKTATVVSSYDSRQWVDRWLYRGLHSLDFPWLYNNRPLWDVVVITLMLGGAGLCVTSLVLTWRVVMRTLASAWRARAVLPDDDLAPEVEVRRV